MNGKKSSTFKICLQVCVIVSFLILISLPLTFFIFAFQAPGDYLKDDVTALYLSFIGIIITFGFFLLGFLGYLGWQKIGEMAEAKAQVVARKKAREISLNTAKKETQDYLDQRLVPITNQLIPLFQEIANLRDKLKEELKQLQQGNQVAKGSEEDNISELDGLLNEQEKF